MSTGIIFDIEHGSFVDGPGIRTAVFFKGCNLQCRWCHNPESQEMKPQKLYYENRCLNCRRCREVCTSDTCVLCGKCAAVCPGGALSICGKEYTAEQVLEEIRSDAPFFGDDGGVTFSGGECMLQADFLLELLTACRREKIHTAIDTAGGVPYEYFERVIPVTDLFLYDVKCYDTQLHKIWTGTDNRQILENLIKIINAGCTVDIRIPVIPGVNDSAEEMENIRRFFEKNGRPRRIELLPYHRMGENKYRALGKEPESFAVPDADTMERLKNIFKDF